MSLENLRDLIIVIVGIEIIILSIAFGIFGLIIYRKVRRTVESIKMATRSLRNMIGFIRSIGEMIKGRQS